jgi:hypothetical protein
MNWVSSIWLFASMWYQCYSHVHVSFYVNVVNICCQFQSCEQVSFMCSHFIQVIYYHSCCQFHPRDETQTYGPIPYMSKFIEKQQVQPYGPISFMWSSSSKCIIHVVKKFMDFIHLTWIFISRLKPYWHQCHACGKTQFPVKFIQYPLSRKWSV